MNQSPKLPTRTRHCAAYQRAFDRLDDALERDSGFSNAEKIRLLMQTMFADLDKPAKSVATELPQ